ncbi:MAG TPA: hypothetical protein VKB72_04965 [Steroidobacteraceae bacterium]|nr:hypothetical protein [Steroidobacteraceae bacterium]
MANSAQSLNRAITLATRLRAASEKNKANAEFKGLIDDILLELAEVQMRLEEVFTENVSLKSQAHAKAHPKGELCPRCGEFGWKVINTRPHGQQGAIAQTYSCPKCGLKEEVLTTPR